MKKDLGGLLLIVFGIAFLVWGFAIGLGDDPTATSHAKEAFIFLIVGILLISGGLAFIMLPERGDPIPPFLKK